MSKEAMKLALEAMESFQNGTNGLYEGEFQEEITAIKEALAQSEQDGSVCARCGGIVYDPVIKQEQGEPVAYIHRNEYNEYRLEPHDNFDIKSIPFNVDVPLFKSPQQRAWVGLTDEDDIDWDGTGNLKQLVEAVEAKLKEKNT